MELKEVSFSADAYLFAAKLQSDILVIELVKTLLGSLFEYLTQQRSCCETRHGDTQVCV